MSRAERRAYKRMTKSQDPYAVPAAAKRGRAATRTARRAQPAGPFVFWSPRFMTWLVGGAIAAGLLAFSVAWPSGLPLALWIGLGGAAAWAGLVVGLRFLQGRRAASRS
ncbi:MAG TPA: hypothetical protein VIH19_07040 [Candidatus Limnocylindria bacterium]|jgi:hypothetical protein